MIGRLSGAGRGGGRTAFAAWAVALAGAAWATAGTGAQGAAADALPATVAAPSAARGSEHAQAAPPSWPLPSDSPQSLAPRYEAEVARRIVLPDDARAGYATRLLAALDAGGIVVDRPQLLLLVDRHPQMQLGMLWWVGPGDATGLIGASPVSTGRPSGFEHFETPLGVFPHTIAAPDFRAEGTKNEFGIRGYGERGMRVYDFGWVRARRGWAPGEQDMRLQVHATDPDRLEPLLGRPASKGCIRIPAAMNRFIDRYGVLDADYDAELDAGRHPWVLPRDRVRTPWSGRWLVIVDSGVTARPEWNPAPKAEATPDSVLARLDC